MSHTKVILLALLIVAGMIISPVCALGYDIVSMPLSTGVNSSYEKVYNLTVDESTRNNAIQRIVVDTGTGTVVDFTLWYGNGQTVSGQMEYRNSTDCADWIPFDAYCQYSGVSIGTDIQGYSYRGVQEIGRIDIATYARNWTTDTAYTTGFIVYDSVFGISERKAMAYFPVPNGTSNVVYKFSIVATKPVTVGWNTNTYTEVATGVSQNILETAIDWKNKIETYSYAIYGFIASLFSFVILFFVGGNFLLVIVLWLGVTLAYSAMTAGSIFKFYAKFFKLQRAFLEFVIFLWNALVYIVTAMVQALLKWL